LECVPKVRVRVRVRVKNGGRALRKIRLRGIQTEHAKTETRACIYFYLVVKFREKEKRKTEILKVEVKNQR
jgi:hypothetical protein